MKTMKAEYQTTHGNELLFVFIKERKFVVQAYNEEEGLLNLSCTDYKASYDRKMGSLNLRLNNHEKIFHTGKNTEFVKSFIKDIDADKVFNLVTQTINQKN